jgi:predicted phage-related endonuclease
VARLHSIEAQNKALEDAKRDIEAKLAKAQDEAKEATRANTLLKWEKDMATKYDTERIAE